MSEANITLRRVTASQLLSVSYGFLKSNKNPLIKASILPFVLGSVISIIQLRFFMSDTENLTGDSISNIITALINLAVLSMLAVCVHRQFLINTVEKIQFGKREIVFISVGVLFYFIMIAVLAPIMFTIVISGIGGILLSILAGFIVVYVTMRISLVFPAIAVDTSDTLKEKIKTSWRAAKGNVLSMFLAYLGIGIVFIVPTFIGDITFVMVFGNQTSTFFSVSAVFNVFLTIISTIWTVLVVSVAYKLLVPRDDDDDDAEMIVEPS